MRKILIVSTIIMLSLSMTATASTITQTQVTGNSVSAGIYQSEAVGVRVVNKSSFGHDAQTYQNDCGSSCNTDNTAGFTFAESVNTVTLSGASSMGVETSATSFCSTSINTDNLAAGNSNSTTNNSRAGVESNSSLTMVSGTRTEVETTTNGGAEYGRATTVSNWESLKQDSYTGVTASTSVITSQSSFMR